MIVVGINFLYTKEVSVMVVESLGPAERGAKRPPHSRQDARALGFAAQVEEFRVLLAMVDERPLFGVMIVVD